jgi:serine/threonine-protein kinase
MELLDGFDLEKLVKRFGPLLPERVIYFLLQVCDSLGEAHLQGLIHRDIKPKNIFVSRLGLYYDFIKVLDFGLVKSTSREESTQSEVTMAGTTTGTPAYMAPEVALGKTDVDGRADIYSLGCVAYWLCTGQLVFEGSGSLPIILAHIQSAPIPPSQRTEVVLPADFEQVILSCLEKDPERRPQTAEELRARLNACSVANAWNQTRAREWWRMHMPSLVLQPAVRPQEANEFSEGRAVGAQH